MIIAVNGPIGHGKGSYMSLEAIKLADEGLDVYTNWPVFHPRVKHINTWAEVALLGDAEVFVDEAHLWFSARATASQGKIEDISVWAQSRHDGLNIYWSSQKPGQVDKQIREDLTHEIIKIHRLFGPRRIGPQKGKPTFFEELFGAWAVVIHFEAQGYGQARLRIIKRWRFMRISDAWGKYDTHWIVGDRLGNGARAGRGSLATTDRAARFRARWLKSRENVPLMAPGQWGYTDAKLEDDLTTWRNKKNADGQADSVSTGGGPDGLNRRGRTGSGTQAGDGGVLLEEPNRPRFRLMRNA